MTTFFSIHGFEVEVSSFARDQELVGLDRRRSEVGSMRQTRIARKENFDAETTILDPTTAIPVLELLHGEGHVYSFDTDKYSSKGLGWTGTQPSLDSTNKKFGASSGAVASAGTATCPFTDTTTRSVLLWRRPNSGSFNHYAFNLSGSTVVDKYKNGATTVETISNWFTAGSTGTFSLLGKNDAGTNSIAQYDDVIVLPFALTSAMATAWAAQTRAWADLPNLNINGDCVTAIGGTNLVMLAQPGKTKYIRANSPLDNTFKATLQQHAFTLKEV